MKLKNSYRHFQLTTDESGVVTLALNVVDRPLNVLNAEVIAELADIVTQLEQSHGREISAVVIRSSKESGFLAGADVNAIAEIADRHEAGKVIELGQMLFQRVENLPFPTIAVIDGPCMGGGLELALACRYRIARNVASTQLGLPEIKLGLIPGWGGTQRLPRLIGLHLALSMILTGKSVRPAEALQIGLIDEAIEADQWEEGIDAFISQIIVNNINGRRSFTQRLKRFITDTAIVRALVVRKAESSIHRRAKHYPVLPAAVRAAAISFDPAFDGYLVERAEFLDLLYTPTCRNLLGLYLSRTRAQKVTTWISSGPQSPLPRRPIQNVAVIGAGVMGAGIGQWAAIRGFNVVLKEVDQDIAASAQDRIHRSIHSLAQRQNWSSTKTADVKSRISVTATLGDIADANLVIEAVAENMEIKSAVFQDIESIVRPSTLVVSNTSSLSIDDMASNLMHPNRFAGLHFFNPVHRMDLVEVVRGTKSDEAAMGDLITFVRSLGKVPVVTNDSPGFVVNRILFPYLSEAMRMVMERIAPETIDAEARDFGMPMGPIELLDQVGLDVALQVARSLGEIQEENSATQTMLARMVERRELGQKVGKGFYHYHKGKKTTSRESSIAGLAIGNRLAPPAILADRDDGMTAIQRRLIYPMLIEAKRCLDERVVEFPWAIDLAMVLGTGFAPHLGGPLSVIKQIGFETFDSQRTNLERHFGERFSLGPATHPLTQTVREMS
ncbi:3-hydroxyacyl-CoA dehydrogenase NAD-binding domain-containing protein [Rubripirellula amarantea]|nr:3-hydroxyacyl-CoA dehydrogenase NAD-binding domain-containing protein [Rubripirellula amarantea]